MENGSNPLWEVGGVKEQLNTGEIVMLFHPPTIVKVVRMVRLLIRSLSSPQKMRNSSNPYWEVVREQLNKGTIVCYSTLQL